MTKEFLKAKKASWTAKGRAGIEVKHIRWTYDNDPSRDGNGPKVIVSRTRLGARIATKPIEKVGAVKESQAARTRRKKAARLEAKYIIASTAILDRGKHPRAIGTNIILEVFGGKRKYRRRKNLFTRALHPTSKIERLPTETLLQIQNNLQAADRLCLAMSSRMMLLKLGLTKREDLSSKQKKLFARRLEQDMVVIPRLVACTWCLKLHRPFLSIQSESVRRSQEKPQLPCTTARPHSYTSFHKRLHFNLVSYIMGRHRNGLDSGELLRQVQHTRTTQCIIWKNEFYLQKTEKSRIIDGLFFTKAQTVVFPACGSWDNCKLIDSLIHLLKITEDKICPHRGWKNDIRRNLIPRWDEDGKKKGNFARQAGGTFGYPQIGAELRCLLVHGRTCDYHCQGGSIEKREIGCPGSCSLCYTDFSLNVINIPGPSARLLVLTTWKNLGICEKRCEEQWQSFEKPRRDEAGNPPRAYRATMRQGRQAIFRPYEEADDPDFSYGGPNHVHRPRLKPLDVMRLIEFPQRLQYETADCGLPHRPTPEGAIYYPDPLD
ncbi:hypothetical protein AB5N19_08198 [Seiridium cardinale]